MMIASKVPTAIGMANSGGWPSRRQTSKNTGTGIAPPPMPNSPARKPISAPDTCSTPIVLK